MALLYNGEAVQIAEGPAIEAVTAESWDIQGAATAELRLTELDQTGPAGRFRLQVSGDQLFIQRGAGDAVDPWSSATTLLTIDDTGVRVEYPDDAILAFGTDSDAQHLWSTGDADNHSYVVALGDDNQGLHITDVGARATDWNIAATTHPNVYIHSNTTPATDYLRLGDHDGTTAYVDVVGGTTLAVQVDGATQASFTTAVLNLVTGNTYQINGTDVLSNDTLGTGVLTSSLTTVGALASGSIASGFGSIVATTIDATTDFTIGSTVITDGVITDSTGLQIAANVDLNSNTLSNVGVAGNDWTANELIVSSGFTGTQLLTLANTNNADIGDHARIILTIGGSNGGDPQIVFNISGADSMTLGLDNTASDNFTISNATGLGSNDRLRLAKTTGILSLDGSGAGDAVPTLFDDLDDAVEVRTFQMANVPLSLITWEQQLENQKRLVEIGVAEWAIQEDGSYHWMMRIQPMTRLLAGGIYQNRWAIDALREESISRFSSVEERLAAVEEAQGIVALKEQVRSALLDTEFKDWLREELLEATNG